MTEVPVVAIALAKQFEGFHHVPKFDPERRVHPYICPADYWTIGYGHLCDSNHPLIDLGDSRGREQGSSLGELDHHALNEDVDGAHPGNADERA